MGITIGELRWLIVEEMVKSRLFEEVVWVLGTYNGMSPENLVRVIVTRTGGSRSSVYRELKRWREKRLILKTTRRKRPMYVLPPSVKKQFSVIMKFFGRISPFNRESMRKHEMGELKELFGDMIILDSMKT